MRSNDWNWINISGALTYMILCYAISESMAVVDCSNFDPSHIKYPIVKQLDKNGTKVQVSWNGNDRTCAGLMVFLKYEPYVNYQKDARLTNVALLINSTSQNIDVTPEVDYVFQFSLVDQKSEITIFKTQLKPEIEIPMWMKSYEYYCNGILSMIIASIGIVINVMGIAVMVFQRRKRNNFHKLVIFLAVWDLLILIMISGCLILPVLSPSYNEVMAFWMFRYAMPFTQILVTGSIYSTLMMTIDRYIAVCIPLQRTRYTLKFIYYIISITCFAAFYNIPRFFEWNLIYTDNNNCIDVMEEKMEIGRNNFLIVSTDVNSNELSKQCIALNDKSVLEATDLRRNFTYILVYKNILNLAFNQIGPITVLIILNIFIYKSLKKHRIEMLDSIKGGQVSPLKEYEHRMTRTSIIITLAFLICHIPRMVPNLLDLILPYDELVFFAIYNGISNLLLIINSSVNFIFYFTFCGRGMKSLVGKFSRSADSQTATNVINGTRVLECHSPIYAQVIEMQKISRRNHSPSGPQNLLLESSTRSPTSNFQASNEYVQSP